MSIDTVLLIVILTFGVGFVLNRLDMGRSSVPPRQSAQRYPGTPPHLTEFCTRIKRGLDRCGRAAARASGAAGRCANGARRYLVGIAGVT